MTFLLSDYKLDPIYWLDEMSEKEDYEIQWPGLKIKYLVISTAQYVVFLDKDLDVDWKTTDEYDEVGHQDITRHNHILNMVAQLESIPAIHHELQTRISYKRMIGEAVARTLEHDYENADKILTGAKKYIENRNTEVSRLWYLYSSGIASFACFSLLAILWHYRDAAISLWGSNALLLLLSSFAGGIGAFLSIILRIGKTSLNSASGFRLHFAEGVSRIIAGCISGLLIALLIKLEILVPIFAKAKLVNMAMFAGGIFAGASERLIPSLIEKVDTEAKDKK